MIIHLKTTKNRLKNKLFAKTRYNASSLQDYKCKNKIKQLPKFIVYVYVSDIRAVQYDINFQLVGFKPKLGTTTALDSMCPRSFFKTYNEACNFQTISLLVIATRVDVVKRTELSYGYCSWFRLCCVLWFQLALPAGTYLRTYQQMAS